MKLNARLAAGLICISALAPARAAVCPPAAETITITAITGTKVVLDKLVQALFDYFAQQLTQFGQHKVTGIKVMTSQVATATKAKINSDVGLSLGHMSAVAHLETVQQQLKVYQDFSPQTGQGVDPCGQLVAQTNVTLATGHAAAMAAEAISHVAAAPGRYGNPDGFNLAMLKRRQAMFATEDEAKLGLGTAQKAEIQTASGGRFSLAGADTNARVLFADSSDPRVLAAREAYLNHMAGAPDLPITAAMAALPAGKEYLALKARKDAAMSTALNSLAVVGAENTPNKELGKSKMQAMRDLVNTYHGPNATQRYAASTGQSVRGMMVDQVKMGAAMLSIEVDQLQQAQRHEALLGTLLALEAQRDYRPALSAATQANEAARARPGVR